MRKLILSDHISLDGFVAGPNREIDWIIVDEEIMGYVKKLTDQADTALYGRVTYDIMAAYWPTAGDQPDASEHDIEHSRWYNRVNKVVISHTMADQNDDKIQIIGKDLVNEVRRLKQQPGESILMLGSPSAAQALMAHGLIDEYWLFLNPILLKAGIPLFTKEGHQENLKLIETRVFPAGVVALRYIRPQLL